MDPVHPPVEVPTLPPAAITALHGGNKIEAIKLVRQERRIGLKEAKDLVDAYEAAHPALRTLMASAPGAVSSGAWLWAVVVVLLAWLAWRFLA